MIKQKASQLGIFGYVLRATFIGLLLVGILMIGRWQSAQGAPSTTLNFQARLLNSTGSLVADGTYNIEFKLYNASSGGSPLWTETRTSTDKVTVRAGYFSVQLGSVTALPTTNWNEELWLTMNVGGTGTPTWDGEMNPRIKLTAVPFAFQAEQLAKTSGANRGTLAFNTVANDPVITLPDASGTLCIQGASSCGFATGSGAAWLQGGNDLGGTTAGTIGTINNGALNIITNNTTRLSVASTGEVQVQGGSLAVGTTTQQGSLIMHDGNGQTATISVGSGLVSDTSLAIPTGVGTSDTICLETLGNCTGGAGGAPDSAEYLTLSADSTLSAERVLTSGANLSFTDGGANGNFTIATVQNPTFTTSVTTPLLTSSGALDITPGGALTVGATGQSNLLRGSTLTLTSNGAGNDITLTSADQIIVDAGSTIELQDNTNVTGNLAVSGNTSLGDSAGDTVDINGHLAVGNATPGNEIVLSVNDTFTSTANCSFGCYGISSNVTANSPTSPTGLTGIYAETSTANASFTLSNAYGVAIGNGSKGASSTITNNYGLFVFDQTKGSSDYGIVVQGADTYALWVQADTTRLDGLLELNSLGTADTSTALCRNSSNQIATCSGGGSAFLQGGNSFGALAQLGTTDSNGLQVITNSVGRAYFDTSNNLYLGNASTGGTAAAPNDFTLRGTGSGTSGTAGGNLAIFGGAGATVGAGSAGGSLTLQGGGGGGSNLAGGTVAINGGQGTGTGLGGNILLQVAIAGTSGSSSNSLSTVGTISGIDGSVLLQNAVNSTTAFNIQNVAGHNMFTVDTLNKRVGIGLGGAYLPGATLEVSGPIRLSGFDTGAATLDTFLTPVGSSVGTAINIPYFNPTGYSQVLSLGIGASSWDTARVISVFDARTVTHQPSIGVFSPDESNLFGFSWEGGNSTGYLKTTGGSLGIKSGTTDIATFGTSAISLLQTTSVTGNLSSTGTLQVGTLGATDTATLMCRNSSNIIAACSSTGTGAVFVNDGNSFSGTATLGTNDSNSLVFETNNTTRATFDTSNGLYLGNGVTAASPSGFTVSGTGSSTSGVAGGTLTLQGGNATVGNANGGNLALTGGAGVGTGVRGLVVIDTPTFTTASVQNFTGSGTITAANVDSSGAILISSNAAGYTVTLGDPTNTTAGKILYVTNSGAYDMTLSINGGGTGNTVALKPNTSATMVWNGSDWTAAGASSSTDLQSAYNNTLTSAGGAELVLNAAGGAADGLTIRNNATTPISGGILEVQTSIGTNVFSVNNLSSELVANGGGEDSTNFSTNWTALGGSSVSRTTTSGQYATGAAGVSVVSGTTAGNGVRNNLASNPATNTVYMISFTAMLSSSTFTDLRVDYTPTGASTGTQCTANQTIVTGGWTRITCEVTTPATAVTNPDILIYQVGAAGASRTFYVDNLSMTLADDAGGIPNNVQIGGGIYGGAPTLFTLDRSSGPPVANGNTTYLGSMYYDTVTGRIQCYESDGWGACGSAPDNIITLTPEYTGAVLNGSGIGTMTADFCSNDTALQVNTSFCASGISRNYYRWTSPQATEQTYSIYVSYKLPNTFKSFYDSNTVKLTWLTDSASGTNGKVTYQVFRSTGSAVTSCDGSTESTVATPSANTWYTTNFNGDETACGFAAGDYIIFKINVKAKSNANVYVENLDFTYLNQ